MCLCTQPGLECKAARPPGHTHPPPFTPAVFWVLFFEFVVYFLLAVYLDHVLADENGE